MITRAKNTLSIRNGIQKIADAAATGNADLQQRVLKGRDEAMSELNGQMLQRSEEWQQLFGDLDNLTVTQIENLHSDN